MTDLDGDRVDRLYAELARVDGLLADSLWHRVEGFRRMPRSGRCAMAARSNAAAKLRGDLRLALRAAEPTRTATR